MSPLTPIRRAMTLLGETYALLQRGDDARREGRVVVAQENLKSVKAHVATAEALMKVGDLPLPLPEITFEGVSPGNHDLLVVTYLTGENTRHRLEALLSTLRIHERLLQKQTNP